jgi:hypothetical protein
MKFDGAVKEAGAGASGAKFAHGITGGLHDTGVLSETQIIVGANHQAGLPFADDMVAMGLLDTAEIGIESLGAGYIGIRIGSALGVEVSWKIGHLFIFC